MKFIYNWILLLIILTVAAGLYLYNGMYNFAATSPHNNLTSLVIHESMERSVKKHAKYIDKPQMKEESGVQDGFEEYDEMCAMCHGAPGLPESVLYKGLYPKPPKLYENHEDWTDEELFWIIKNGIKMTGMPAYGPTHTDEEIWNLVAFIKELPNITDIEYKKLMEKNSNHHSHEDDDHKHHEEGTGVSDKNKKNVHIHEDGSEHVH